MSHKRKGQLTVSGEWAKHLRKFRRRQFWKGERIAGKKMIESEKKINDYFLSGKPFNDVQLSKLIEDGRKSSHIQMSYAHKAIRNHLNAD